MNKLISFITPSRNLKNIKIFLDNLEKTTADLSKIEVLIKFDDDQAGVNEFIKEEISHRPFDIKVIVTPRLEGIFSLWIAMEDLFFQSNPSAYFVQIISDEVLFLTHHWDVILQKYIGFFPDHVFRLRLSSMKFASYTSHYECTFRPDSFPIYTRRWLELTEGSGDCWGSDAYQQCVAFQLSLGIKSYSSYYRTGSLCRDVVVYDIELSGLEFAVGISEEESKERHKRNHVEWNRLTSAKMQRHFAYLARRIYGYIWAVENNFENIELVKKESSKELLIFNNGRLVNRLSYKIPTIYVASQNLRRICLHYLYDRKNYFSKKIKYCKQALIKILRLWVLLRVPYKIARFFQKRLFGLDKILYRHIILNPIKILHRLFLKPTYMLIGRQCSKLLPKKKSLPLKPMYDPALPSSPGIDVIFKKNVKPPFRISPPTQEQLNISKDNLMNIRKNILQLRDRKFKLPIMEKNT